MTLNSETLKEKLQKLKAFSVTNTGVVVITIIVFIFLLTLRFAHNRHNENNADESFAAWNTPVASTPKKQIQKNTLTPPVMEAADTQDLQSQINALNQKVDLLIKQVNQITVTNLKKPYQLLGVRFDDHAQQWVADVKVDNTLYSLKSGQTFEGWHVVSVDSEGAQIE